MGFSNMTGGVTLIREDFFRNRHLSYNLNNVKNTMKRMLIDQLVQRLQGGNELVKIAEQNECQVAQTK